MIILGLTGSIGMGKSTTADMFRALGVPVHDADRTVHDLYASDLAGPIEDAFPGTVKDGVVDRGALAGHVLDKPAAMKRLEAIVHPAVRDAEEAFLRRERENGTPVVLLDIPLLFETGGDARVDKIVVVTADPDIQRERVLSRPAMTEEKFDQILSRQLPDPEKRERADFIIDTGKGMEAANEAVSDILRSLTG
ncbi:MAG: dephospho-CoA kinase [Pseudomonadota bacterium]